MSEIIRSIEQKQLRTDLPKISIGDTVRVWVKVVEGSRERLQAFEGVVIAMRNGGVRETFTVRRVSYGIGVERTFPMHSPRVDHVEIIRSGKVRRAKLYYLRNLQGKAAKLKEVKRVRLRAKKVPCSRYGSAELFCCLNSLMSILKVQLSPFGFAIFTRKGLKVSRERSASLLDAPRCSGKSQIAKMILQSTLPIA